MQLKLIVLKWTDPLVPIKTLQGHKRACMRAAKSLIKHFKEKFI